MMKQLRKLFVLLLAVMLAVTLVSCPEPEPEVPTPEPGVEKEKLPPVVLQLEEGQTQEKMDPGSMILLEKYEKFDDADIRYTTDGSEPTEESTIYKYMQSYPIMPDYAETFTVKFKAFPKSGKNFAPSDTQSFTFKRNPDFLFPIEFYKGDEMVEGDKLAANENVTLTLKTKEKDVSLSYKIGEGEEKAYTDAGITITKPEGDIAEKKIFTIIAKYTKGEKTQQSTLDVMYLPPSKVAISAYLEGSGNNKFVAITNYGDSPVNLEEEGYTYVSATNIEKGGNVNKIELKGTLPSGKSIVIYNSQIDKEAYSTLLSKSNEVGNANGWIIEGGRYDVNFNGEDKDIVSLERGGIEIDAVLFDGESPKDTFAVRITDKAKPTESDWNYVTVVNENEKIAAIELFDFLEKENSIEILEASGTVLNFNAENNTFSYDFEDKTSRELRLISRGKVEGSREVTYGTDMTLTVGDKTYTVKITGKDNPIQYTDQNYNFDGGLKALRDDYKTNGNNTTWELSEPREVTGVVIATLGINTYLQDQTGSLRVYGTFDFEGLEIKDLKVGDKITFEVKQMGQYNGVPQVTTAKIGSNYELVKLTNIERPEVPTLYYREYNSSISGQDDNGLFKIEGELTEKSGFDAKIGEVALRYEKGVSSDNIEVGKKYIVYAPLNYYRANQLAILSPNQITEVPVTPVP